VPKAWIDDVCDSRFYILFSPQSSYANRNAALRVKHARTDRFFYGGAMAVFRFRALENRRLPSLPVHLLYAVHRFRHSATLRLLETFWIR